MLPRLGLEVWLSMDLSIYDAYLLDSPKDT